MRGLQQLSASPVSPSQQPRANVAVPNRIHTSLQSQSCWCRRQQLRRRQLGQPGLLVQSHPSGLSKHARCDRQLHQLKTNASQPSTGPLKQTPSQCRATARRRIVTQCSASAAGQFSRSQDASALQSDVPALVANLRALYQFSRPHTMLGTFISICSVSLLAMGPGDFGTTAAIGLLQALIPALLMNICIVGMNQIFDVDIDKTNKPYLPLASGEWSLNTGISMAVSTGLVAVLLALYIGSTPLLATVVGSLLLGIAYSVDLPFLRWKKYPVLAMGCILSVRAIMVQLGFYFHMQRVLRGSRVMLTWPLVFAIGFMLVFSIVIALFKDIPDVKGDKEANVQTLSVRLGQKRVFWACITLLELAYAGAIGIGSLSQVWWSKLVTVSVHLALGGFLLRYAQQVDLQDTKSITSCYMLVWKLFYSEYLLIPFFR